MTKVHGKLIIRLSKWRIATAHITVKVIIGPLYASGVISEATTDKTVNRLAKWACAPATTRIDWE